jgi:hypothetical protein
MRKAQKKADLQPPMNNDKHYTDALKKCKRLKWKLIKKTAAFERRSSFLGNYYLIGNKFRL